MQARQFYPSVRTLSSLVIPAILAATAAPPARAADLPSTMEGRWAVASFVVNDEQIGPDHRQCEQTKIGTIWKLFGDGTGVICGHNQRWEYDQSRRTFTVRQEGALWGYNPLITNADVSMSGNDIVLSWTELNGMVKASLTLRKAD